MNHSTSVQPPENNPAPSPNLREIFADAIRYWEPRRIAYNLILAAVTVAWIALSWPHFRESLTLQSLLLVIVLAMMANLCYCAAYIADVFVQYSALQSAWNRRRWVLWWTGTLFAVVLANYWIADEIYPFVR
jgi:hypothetical protein